MSDTLYLSLWYPNLRLAALPDKLTAVLGAFAAHGGEARVYAATVWPVNWSESPVFQRVYGHAGRGPNQDPNRGVDPRQAVEEAMELLHDDYAYELQIGWNLWELETPEGLDARWVREPRLVRVTGFGPLFDEGAYEQDGHIRLDFGTDAPFLEIDAGLDETGVPSDGSLSLGWETGVPSDGSLSLGWKVGARHVEENVRQLVELTATVEKDSGATARLLWSELGESLAQRLAARLGMRN